MRDFVPPCMLCRVRPLPAVFLVLCASCNSPTYLAIIAEQEAFESSSTSGTGDTTADDLGPTEVGTTSAEPGSSSGDTTGVEASGTSSTGEEVNASPHIFGFAASPHEVFEAGPVDLELNASDDVVEVDLRYGDVLLATVPIDAFPFTFDVTSQAVCEGSQSFTATVRDAEGLTDSQPADLYCQLPAPGSEVYTRVLPGKSASGGTAVASRPDGSVVVAGELDGRMALWRLDPQGNVLQGWPKTLATWTTTPGLAATESSATAVAIDSTEAIVVAGVVMSGITTRRYVARLSSEGALLWEDPGLKDGEEIAGVAVSSALDIVVAGACRTSLLDQALRYDACVWGYPKGYPKQAVRWSDQFKQPDMDPIPDKDNLRSERGRAVVAFPDGSFAVFGEREFWAAEDLVYTRAMSQRYSDDGARVGALWTSPGLKVANDAAFAATVTPTGIVAAGWCRHELPGAIQQVCVQEFDAEGAQVGFFVEPSPMPAEARTVAQDREGKTLIGGFTTKPGQTDAWIFASRGADQPLAWSQTYDDGGWDFARGVACDLWGHCTWVGTTTIDGALGLIVSQRHP